MDISEIGSTGLSDQKEEGSKMYADVYHNYGTSKAILVPGVQNSGSGFGQPRVKTWANHLCSLGLKKKILRRYFKSHI